MIPSDEKRSWLKEAVDQKAPLMAIRYLENAREAREKLKNAKNAEALHNFRVALRRLRVFLGCYREFLGDAGQRRMRKKLKSLSVSTNDFRDAEVYLGYLDNTKQRIQEISPGLRRIKEKLGSRIEQGRRNIAAKILPESAEILDRILKQLRVSFGMKTQDVRHRVTLEEAFREQVALNGKKLHKQLSRVHSLSDKDEIHASRIQAKRLRYLIEPFVKEFPEGPKVLRLLRGLQDLLGELHDIQGLKALIRVRAVREELARREQKLYGDFSRAWLERHHRHFFDALKGLS